MCMEEKYYPVFISSTKVDLEDLRLDLEHMLMRTKFFPIGMENFNASNSDVWDVITSKLDKASFVVLIIGDRYGEFDEITQKSYTHREYEYAIEHNIPVLGFIKNDKNQNIIYDVDYTKLQKLNSFKKQVMNAGKLIEQWTNETKKNLSGIILTALENELGKMISRGAIPRGLVYDDSLDSYILPKKTVMNFYNVHAVVKGTEEECNKGTAVVTYVGSAVVDSPKRPVVFEDRVKNDFPILYYKFTPEEILTKEAEFKRNSKILEYKIVSSNLNDKLHFTGEIQANIQLRKEQGGILLHIPYFTESATLFIDISVVSFIKKYNPKAVVWRFDEFGQQKPFEEAHVIFNEINNTYAITARNIPADSNIGLSW